MSDITDGISHIEGEHRCPVCNSTQLIEGDNGLECMACDWIEFEPEEEDSEDE